MKENTMIQTDHHTDPPVVRCHARVFSRFFSRDALEIFSHLLLFGVGAGKGFERALDVAAVREAHEVMDAGDCADEV